MNKIIVVTGATGRQGSAVTRHLIKSGFHVRALTRNPEGKKARAIGPLGAELVRADLDQPASLERAFTGADGVYSVQNFHVVGYAKEVRQGKNVGDAAKKAGVKQFVQASAGIGEKTGIPSWDSKLEIEEYLRSLSLPLTILRPMAFMELMTDKTYYPNAAAFHIMPNLMGASKPVQWLTTDDLGAIAAKVFSEPERFLGKDLKLLSDVKSIDECRSIYANVLGKPAPHFAMPLFMFRLFTGDDMIKMWTWLRTASLHLDPAETRTLLPSAATVESYLAGTRAPPRA